MGREARCWCRWDGGLGEVKALLEANELILRGSLKRTLPIARLKDVRVAGEDLLLTVGTEQIALGLGAATAARWARKIATPPPTLQQKLGVSSSARALVIGEVADPVLDNALTEVRAATAADARVCVAVVNDEAELIEALKVHEGLAPSRPIWIAHRKGPGSSFGENAVRLAMRQRGFTDNKSTAVSAELSATRYARK